MNQEQDHANDKINKIQRCGCLLVFLGEFLAQASPSSPQGYNLSSEAIEGFSYFCIDLGFDLLAINK